MSSPTFSERVLPSAGAWLLAPAGAALIGLALLPLDPLVAAVAAAVAAGLVVLALVAASPVLTVTGGVLTVDRARLPLEFVAAVEELRGDDLKVAMGPGLDARAHVRFRAWSRSAVRVILDDPTDPTPYWLISTRRPRDLASALGHGR